MGCALGVDLGTTFTSASIAAGFDTGPNLEAPLVTDDQIFTVDSDGLVTAWMIDPS